MIRDRFIVYCLENRVNGMRYIGQTRMTLNARWSAHLTDAKRGASMTVTRAIREHGAAAFTGHEILRDLTKAEADMWERELIAGYPPARLYNETAGGPDGKRSARARERMRTSVRPPVKPEDVARRLANSKKATSTEAFREKMREVNRANWAKRRATGGDTGQAAAAARRTPAQRELTSRKSTEMWAAKRGA